MAKKEIPPELVARQEQARQKTYNKIETAAQILKEEGREITRPALTELAGLAPSTFSKDHVKIYLLRRWGIGAYERQKTELSSFSLEDLGDTDLLKKVDDLRRRLISTETKLDNERAKRNKAETRLAEGEEEKKILRGELDLAIRKIRVLLGKKPKAEISRQFAALENKRQKEEGPTNETS